MTSSTPRFSFLAFFILLPVIIFGVYICQNAINVPYDDDEALLITLNLIHEKQASIFDALVIQHNDHRILFSRLGAFLIDFFNGEMNFRIMIICGYLNLILLGHALYLVFKSVSNKLVFFIPASLLLFSPIVYVVHLWSITAFEQTLAITFSIYCLYFLQPHRKNLWLFSIPFAIAATLANLDGLSIIPVALVWLILQKRNKESLIFTAFSAVYLFIFFQGFKFSFSAESYTLKQTIWLIFRGFLSYTGSIVKVLSDSHIYLLSLTVGGFILFVYLLLFVKKFITRESWKNVILPLSFAEICFLKLLACGMMIAMGRGMSSVDSMAAMRFQVYSVSTFILFYLLVLNNLSDQKLRYSVLIIFFMVSGTLSLWSYAKYGSAVAAHNDELKADAYNFPNHGLFIHQYAKMQDHDKAFFRHYTFPEFFPQSEVDAWQRQSAGQGSVVSNAFKTNLIEDKSHYGDYIYPVLNIEIDHLPAEVPWGNVFLILSGQGENDKPFIVGLRVNNSAWMTNLMKKELPPPSFSAIIPKKIPQGTYRAALCWSENGKPKSLLIARDFVIQTPGLFDSFEQGHIKSIITFL